MQSTRPAGYAEPCKVYQKRSPLGEVQFTHPCRGWEVKAALRWLLAMAMYLWRAADIGQERPVASIENGRATFEVKGGARLARGCPLD